jgi:YbbR domain-containing protein
MQKVRSFLSNIFTFLLSLVLAILIWIVAVQANDPIRQEILPVSVQFVGQPPDSVLVEPTSLTVQVRFEGPLSLLTDVTAQDFTAVVDLSNVSLGTPTTVPIEVQSKKTGLTILFTAPDTVDVTIEKLVSVEIPVVLDIRGSVASGHTQGEALIDPQTITVSGTESQVNSLDSARVTVFLNNVKETKVETLQPIFYDRLGRVTSVSNLSLSTNQVTVTIPVSESAGFAEKTIVPNIVGTPAAGYRLLSVQVDPETVLVQGRQTQLNLLSRVQTEPIDITGLAEPTQFQVSLDLPEGISRDSLDPIVVDVDIAPVLTTAIYNRVVVVQGLDENFEATIVPEEVRVVLYGPEPVLNTLVDEEIQVTIDLFGLSSGVYTIAPVVTVPDRGIEIRSVDPPLVNVSMTPVVTPTEEITGTAVLPNSTIDATTLNPETAVTHNINTKQPSHFWVAKQDKQKNNEL